MLIDAADYVYNATNIATDAVDIQGRIIPTEDIDGQPHPLRRENFAYLCEAISEREGSAWWRCPAEHAPVLAQHIGGIGARITSLYPAAGGIWMKPSATYPRTVYDGRTLPEIYAGNAYKSADCTIPATVGNALSANYFRHCFFNINRLRTKFGQETPTPGTVGGTVSATVKDKTGTGSGSAFCDGSQFLALGNANGTGVDVTGSLPSGSWSVDLVGSTLYELYDVSAHYFDAGSMCRELSFAGFLYLGLSAKPAYSVRQLFLIWDVGDSSAPGPGVLIIDPVSARTAENAEGFPFVFGVSIDMGYLRGLVSFAIPGAEFTLTGASERSYYVRYSGCYVLGDAPFKSILPSAWTWTPT